MARVQIGVRALSTPANELSILVSAMQKKKAGKNVPKNPDKIIGANFFLGTALSAFPRNGNKIMPALNILKEATWYAFSPFKPSFISINELPQMNASRKKRAHLTKLFLFMDAKGR